MAISFTHRTYLVLEMPSTLWVNEVHAFRAQHEPWRRKLPVEITIVGSSGVGVFSPDENPHHAFGTIDRLVCNRKPLRIRFGRKNVFPGSHLYFFEPDSPSDLIQLQQEIIETGLKFQTTPYPFAPHCTIADLGETPDADALAKLNAISVPSQEVSIFAISFYQLADGECTCIHRSPFGDSTASN